jgi:hypothetical protein
LKFRDAVKDGLTRVGWFGFHDPAIVAPVSFTDPMTGMESEGVFLGGQQPGQEDADWTQFNLDIEPMSMRRIDPQQQQGLQLIQSGQLPGVMPGVNQQLQPPPAGSAPGVQMASAGAPIGAMPKPPTSQSRPALPGGAAGGMASGLAGAGAGTFGGPGAGR